MPALKILAPLALGASLLAHGALADPLDLDGQIPLGHVSGRIDHLAIDYKTNRLFVSELGNDTVGVLNITTRKIIREIPNEHGAQGVGFVAATNTLYVASGDYGTVDALDGDTFRPAGQIDLGRDADDIRVDAKNNEVLVGYGGGGLATIDAATRMKVADVKLPHHPEGFELSDDGSKVFVNVPGAREIAVIDRKAGKIAATWRLKGARANYPMAIDRVRHRVLVATRSPARLLVFRDDTGAMLYSGKTCGDADDLFVDRRRDRVYVICGHGFIDTFQHDAKGYHILAHMPTVPGARTGLYSHKLDLLFVAVRARGKTKPAIWIYRPGP